MIFETRYITLLSKYVFVILLTLQATNVHGNVTNVLMKSNHARNGVQKQIPVGLRHFINIKELTALGVLVINVNVIRGYT